jgi:hypothetical protein
LAFAINGIQIAYFQGKGIRGQLGRFFLCK